MTRLVVTTRRTRVTCFLAAWRLRTTFLAPPQGAQGLAVWALAAGTSAICIAPVPMIAPPQVQAQSLARAIRTDIGFSFFPLASARVPSADTRSRLLLGVKGQSFVNAAIALTAFQCPTAGIRKQIQ